MQSVIVLVSIIILMFVAAVLITIIKAIGSSSKKIQKNINAFNDGKTLRFVDFEKNTYIPDISIKTGFSLVDDDIDNPYFLRYDKVYPVVKCLIALEDKNDKK